MLSRSAYKKLIKKASHHLVDARDVMRPFLPIRPLSDLVDSYSRSVVEFENTLLGSEIPARDGSYRLLLNSTPAVKEWLSKAMSMNRVPFKYDTGDPVISTMLLLQTSIGCMRPSCVFKPPCHCGWTLTSVRYFDYWKASSVDV